MDRLERKTNMFYQDYLPVVKEEIAELEARGHNCDDMLRLMTSLQEATDKKDYLTADYLIDLLMEGLEAARQGAGLGVRGFVFD